MKNKDTDSEVLNEGCGGYLTPSEKKEIMSHFRQQIEAHGYTVPSNDYFYVPAVDDFCDGDFYDLWKSYRDNVLSWMEAVVEVKRLGQVVAELQAKNRKLEKALKKPAKDTFSKKKGNI